VLKLIHYTFLSTGDHYIGSQLDGLPHGFGVYHWLKVGQTHIGWFKNGVAEGDGIRGYETGMKYVGEFMQGMQHGQGRLLYEDGSVATGTFANDATDIVTFEFKGNSTRKPFKYVGRIGNNGPIGFGKMYYDNG
jgi:hypothetical protein